MEYNSQIFITASKDRERIVVVIDDDDVVVDDDDDDDDDTNQRRIQDPFKHLKQSFLRKELMAERH